MTRHTSHQSEDAYDLGRIFIGRQHQLDLFKIYFARWQQLLFQTDPDLDPPVTSSPSPRHTLQGLVVLLYGRGGFGKSTLLRHYRAALSYDIKNNPSYESMSRRVTFRAETRKRKIDPSAWLCSHGQTQPGRPRSLQVTALSSAD